MPEIGRSSPGYNWVYQPIPINQKIYDRLFAEYVRLHNYFGRGETDVMKTLKQIRAEVG